ncbi:glycosyltransferase 61 family protein [Methylobacterium sp. Leaf100]|uniref:glycosyltransferase family 61 protein n=1 Tax=Methylobacterium sp. Leaf100 TaxID=1736252 RepID=UPI000B28DD16|nr:glycosyltransferase 61 family protein [Methylobacterium sp. Leaf100]
MTTPLQPRTVARCPLDGVAAAAGTVGELCAGPAIGIRYHEFAAPYDQVVQPLCWLGPGDRATYDLHTASVPPVRLYRMGGGTHIFGKGLLVRDDALIELDRYGFHELGRFDYPFNAGFLQLDGTMARIAPPARVRVIDEPCILLSQGGEAVWGHWLLDLWPRLIMALSAPMRVRIILDADVAPWVAGMLRNAGIGPDRVIWHDKGRETLLADDVYVPGFLRWRSAVSPWVNLAWNLFPAAPGAGPQRLYVSRTRTGEGSSLSNAAEIEAMAVRRGYTLVHPESLPLDRQVALFAGATHVVGEAGSALHNTAFSPAGTRVGVMLSPTGFIRILQAGIGHVRAQPTGFAFGDPAGDARRITMPGALATELLDAMDAVS